MSADYLTESQAAEVLQVPAADVRRLIRCGRLRGVPVMVSFTQPSGRRCWRKEYRVRRAWLDEFGDRPAPEAGARPWPRLRAKG